MRTLDGSGRIAALAAMLVLCSWQDPGRARAVGEAVDEAVAAPQESCIRCHSDPDFLVTHPKLYEYYRDWQRSIHAQEQVTCFDCHGGDPDAPEASRAHAGIAGTGGRDSMSFARVHETCGDCHDEIVEAYTRSKHYERLKQDESGKRHGPTCVTCHRSMNTLTLDVTTVEEACTRCHNAETNIDPEVPAEARAALNKFLSIDRFHRYIAARMEPAESGLFFRDIDQRVTSLSVLWHTFDLERVKGETRAVLDVMRAKRDEIRKRGNAATRAAPTAQEELSERR
ncbi:MAG: cytochrome c3 family protein [Planctomycetota bacterium]|jgi:hypothetical protein